MYMIPPFILDWLRIPDIRKSCRFLPSVVFVYDFASLLIGDLERDVLQFHGLLGL